MEKSKPSKGVRECCRLFWEYLLFVYNLLFLLTGCTVCGLGIWTLTEKWMFLHLINVIIYRVAAWVMVANGILAIFVSLLGIWALHYHSRCLLALYTILIVLVLVIESCIGLLCYTQQNQVELDLTNNLDVVFINKYGTDGKTSLAVDTVQQKYQCCGVELFTDWRKSPWKYSKPDLLVPDSCCKSSSTDCGARDHPNNIPYTGCIHRFARELTNILNLVCISCMTVGLLQIIGVVITTCVFSQINWNDTRKQKEGKEEDSQSVRMHNGYWRSSIS